MDSRLVTAILAATLALPVMALADQAATKPSADKPLTKASTVEARATVTAIDPSTRMVTLKGEKGQTFDVEAGPEVKNFDQIKVGDVVKATYTESLAFKLVPKGETPAAPAAASQGVARIPGGAAVGQQVTSSFKVASVDPKTNILWVTLQNGDTKEIHVQDPEAQARLKKLSPGDVVSVTYTESVALQLEKLAH